MESMSIFERINKAKIETFNFAQLAHSNQWILDQDFESIKSNLEKEKITIGIIGQVKNGKSSLLNALIFEKPVLPTSSTPMTSNLSVITYGEKTKAEVEFYSKEEWQQFVQASKDDSQSGDIAGAAREMLEAAESIKDELDKLLGSGPKEIDFNELLNYIGAGGKYVPITKLNKLFLPFERLKGVEIVDTPGFNDPVVSREQRSKEFLSKADVIIVVLYAERPFDAEDKVLMFNHILAAGVGKVVILVNKYDGVLVNGESEENLLKYVKEKRDAEVAKIKANNYIMATIFQESEIILGSSMFAMLGKMEESEIAKNMELQDFYDYYKENFPFLKKPDYLEKSNLPVLEKEIEKILKKERLQTLIKKPISELIGRLQDKEKKLEVDIRARNINKLALSFNSNELVERIKIINEVIVETHKYAINAHHKLEGTIKQLSFEVEKEIRDQRDIILTSELNKLPESGFLGGGRNYLKKCQQILETILLEFRYFINKKMDELSERVHAAFRQEIGLLDQNITKTVTRSRHSIFKEIDELRRSFIGILSIHINEIPVSIKININTSRGFLGLRGVDKIEVVEYARSEINTMFSAEIISGSGMVGAITDKTRTPINLILEVNDDISKVILNSLEDAQRHQNEKQSRVEQLDNEIILIEEDAAALKALIAHAQETLKTFVYE
ncbi:MAG TPA: dynamin family protein [Saprospiraceae bacterium]|nr:dynamin family protein [Saprospiraceae bacterium]